MKIHSGSSPSVVKHHQEGSQISSINHAKSQYLDVSRPVLHLSLPNPLKPDVKPRMNMELEQRRQAMLQLHLSDQQLYSLRTKVRFTLEVWR